MRLIIISLSLLLVLEVLLLLSGCIILLKEEHIDISKGVSRYLDDYWYLSKKGQDSLVCTYFNGRKVIEKMYWNSPAGIFGKEECMVLYKVD